MAMNMSTTHEPVPAAGHSAPDRLTKRKLDDAIAALDLASKPSAAGRDGTGALAKKKRTSSARISTPALLSLLTPRQRPTPAPPITTPPPSYAPTSLPTLIARIATYRLTSFTPKPPSLSPLACSLRGFISDSSSSSSTRDRIQCPTCSHGVVLSPPSEGGWASSAGQRLVEHYRAVLAPGGEGHDTLCPWKVRGCAPTLYRVPREGRRRMLEGIVRAACALEGAGCGGIRVEGSPMEESEEDALVQAAREVEEMGAGQGHLPQPGRTTLLLALFGWAIDTPPTASAGALPLPPAHPILTCELCTRQIFATSYLAAPTSSSLATPSPKAFNLLKQHQSFCPFVDSNAGSTTTLPVLAAEPGTRKTGWEMRLDVLLRGSRRRSITNGSGAGLAPPEGQEKVAVRTREVLSYVRGMLGPKRRKSSGGGASL